MATLFANLPVSAGDGVGAGVDTSAMGATRTVAVKGTFTGTVTVELSNDGGTTYVALASFTDPKQRTFKVSGQYMRVRRSGVVAPAGTPNVDVGGDDIGSSFANLPVTAGDGTGAGVDASALGTFNTVAVSGTFTGSVTIQISLDNVDWLPIAGFSGPGQQSKVFIAQYLRVVRDGVGPVPGTPIVNVGAANDAIGPGGISFDRTIIVAKVNGDATTIEAGLVAANALVPAPDATHPALVWVFPGVYQENPLTIPTGVTVWGQGGFSTIIEALVTTSPLITLERGAEISSASLGGASGVGGIGILASAVGPAFIKTLYISDCTVGVKVDGVARILQVHSVYVNVNGGVLDCGFEAIGGSLDLYSSGVGGSGAGCGLRAGSGATIRAFSVDVGNVESAVLCENGGELHAIGGLLHDTTYGFHIESTGGSIHAYSVDTDNIATYDLYIEAANGTFRGAGNAIRSDQMSIAAGASIASTQLSDFPGDNATMILGELAVGLPNFPSEAIFGEGDSHVRLMNIFRNTNLEAGAWSDITSEMASSSSSTAPAFAAPGIDQCLYIGGLEKEFPGAKIKTTVAIALGAGSLTWEYWNGATWVTFYVMAADSVAPYHSHSHDVFGRAAFEQVRFNSNEFIGWATKALNGTTRYWVRCRQVAAITTSPTLEQIKLHTNRTEINADGVIEHFGTAIIQHVIPWHQRWTDDLSGASPTNGALSLVSGITVTPIDNRFNDNALDGFGGIQTLPIGLDTSRAVTLTWGWIAKANGAPSLVEFQVRQGLVRVGDTLAGALPSALQAQTVSVGVADVNVLKESSFTLRPYLAVPGNKSAFALFRDATGGTPDTLAASIDIVDVRFTGYFWK